MKKLILAIGFLCSAFAVRSQGLDSIIVETYYISNAADATGSIGTLPAGSVTYRLYADMKQGYKFQALYGISSPSHELLLTTTTSFFNNEDRGATTPSYSKANAADNSVMLDSWFSVGGTCTGQMGVLKSSDDGVATVVNADAMLLNADPNAGIALSVQDGMIPGTPETVTFVGFTTELFVFDATSQLGNSFSTFNASVASLNGSVGPDTNNRVLVGQFTTDGQFCYELNVQIGTPTGGVENYVAENPSGSEILLPSLKKCIQTIPTHVSNLNSAVQELKIFPNPTSELFSFEIPPSGQNNSYTIYGVEGKIIFHKDLDANSQKHIEKVDISSFINGVYIIELSLDGETSFKKIIKN